METVRSSSLTDPESGNTSLRDSLLQNLDGSEEYRQAFVEETIRTGLAAQIKTIREKWQGGMKQTEFAERLGKSQSWVSRLEDPNAAIPTVPTLLLVASTFDTGLKVCFAPFSELLDDVVNLSPDALYAPSFREDRNLFPGMTAPRVAAGRKVRLHHPLNSPGFQKVRSPKPSSDVPRKPPSQEIAGGFSRASAGSESMGRTRGSPPLEFASNPAYPGNLIRAGNEASFQQLSAGHQNGN
jgi:transcriptional regulator with XRE-family HTH domain